MVLDLETQLLNLIHDNWGLTTPLNSIVFNSTTGEIVTDGVRFHRNKRRVEGSLKDINLIFYEAASVDAWTNEGMADCRAVVTVETRLPCAGTTNEQVELSKITKTAIREEIYRILMAASGVAHTIAKPTGWEWAYPTRRENKDNFDAPTPMLGEEIAVTVAYQRTI